MLIYGKLGAPAMGAEGAGWATCISRIYMTLFLFIAIIYYDHTRGTGLFRTSAVIEFRRIQRLLSLGFPAALQVTLEMGVFSLATVLVGRLEEASIAAHQIALSAASFTFMVPLGVSSAGAVRVGQALGRRDPAAAARAGWTALLLGAAFMVSAGVIFLLIPKTIVEIFTRDPSVIVMGVSLLFWAAVFQLFDGLQVVATGILRGTGDTRTPMLCNLFGHWLLGLPIGYYLCFAVGWGAVGLWIGLSAGLIAVGIVLVYFWDRKVRQICYVTLTTKTQKITETTRR
jgi:MATE family multidrug resistance protein